MPATYEPIATTTLSSASSTIELTSIPGTYTDLKVIVTLIGTGNTQRLPYLRFNSSSSSIYAQVQLRGQGTTVSGASAVTQNAILLSPVSVTTSEPTFFEIDIFNYAGSTFKTCLSKTSQDQNGGGWVVNQVSMWKSTSAITSISILTTNTNTYDVGSTITLYGITKA